MQTLEQLLSRIKAFLDIPLFSTGKLLLSVTHRLTGWIVTRLLARSSVELGVRLAVRAVIRYPVIAVGLTSSSRRRGSM